MKKSSAIRFCLAFTAILTASSTAWSQATVNENLETASIYVDTANGSDSNPGTSMRPLKTIGAAVGLAETNNVSNVGSRVIINPGTYRESVSVAAPYNVTSKPITFQAAINGTVYVSGAQQFTGWQVYSGNPSIYTNSWTYDWGLCNTLVPGAPLAADVVLRREMMFVNSNQLTQVMAFNEMTVSTFYVDEVKGTIYMWPPSGTNVSSADVEVAVLPSLWSIQGQSNIVLRGLTFEYANTCRESGAVTVSGSNPVSNVLFDADNFIWNNAQGLSFNPSFSYFTVQNSIANHNGEAGFQSTQTTHGLYQNDQANYNNWRGAQGAFYLWNNAGAHFYNMHNLTLTNFQSEYNETYGVHFDTDNDNITVDQTTFYGNFLGSVLMEVSGGPTTFSNSTFCGTAPLNTFSSQIGFILRDSLYVTVDHNTFMNNNAGLVVTGVEGGFPETNWETGQQYQAENQNFTFTNNIVQAGSGQNLFSDIVSDPDWSGWVNSLHSDTNTWWNAAASADFQVPVPTNSTMDDFSTWQQVTGQDSGSTWATPPGNPGAACSGSPDMPDFWFLVPFNASPLTSGIQTPAVFTATLVGLNFNGTAQLSYDGVQNIPGATASWSPSTLAPGQSASFTVTPSSTTPAGTYPITLIANSGNITRTITVFLTFDTNVQLSTTSLDFGNQPIRTPSASETVTLKNTGSTSLSGVNISVSGANAPDFSQTNNCPASLSPKSQCTITVTFTPGNTGSRTGTIMISDSDATSPQQVALSGTGTQPVATLAPAVVAFGSVVVGTTSPAQVLTLSNTGNAPLTITSITIGQSTAFTQTNNCGTSLAAGASCTINVTFTPAGKWACSGTLNVNDNASPTLQQSSLSGTGIQSAVSLSTKSLNFGNQVWQSKSAVKTATVTNTGTANLNITSITVSGSNPGDFAESNNCGSVVAPSGTCTISVTFTPTALGARSAQVTLTDDAPNSPQTVSLNGTGTTSVSFTPKSINFGSYRVGHSSSAHTITVTNLGTSMTLNIGSITVTGPNAGDFTQTNTCGTGLAPGAQCTISVTFTPGQTGTRSGTLNINDNDPSSPQQVSLTGTGT